MANRTMKNTKTMKKRMPAAAMLHKLGYSKGQSRLLLKKLDQTPNQETEIHLRDDKAPRFIVYTPGRGVSRLRRTELAMFYPGGIPSRDPQAGFMDGGRLRSWKSPSFLPAVKRIRNHLGV